MVFAWKAVKTGNDSLGAIKDPDVFAPGHVISTKGTAMNGLTFAIEQERQIGQYYEELAAMAPVRTIGEILTLLAQAKRNHAEALEQIRQDRNPSLNRSQVLSRGSELVRRFARSSTYLDVDRVQVELYEGAREVELQLEQFYIGEALKTDIPMRKGLFNGLSREVHTHYVLIDSLCNVLTNMEEPESMFA